MATDTFEFRIRLSNNVADLSARDRIIYPAGSSEAANTFDILAVHEIGRSEGLRIAEVGGGALVNHFGASVL